MIFKENYRNHGKIILIVTILMTVIIISSVNSVYAIEKTISSNDDLRTTIKSALSTDNVVTINLKPGTYYTSDNSLESIGITGNVTINGLGSGNNRPILDAQNKKNIFMTSTGSTLTLKNLIITNGKSTTEGGGAIHSSGKLNIENCLFLKNTATGSAYGGAIYCEGGTLSIKGSTFTQNTGGHGGAINCYKADTYITNSYFNKNKAFHGGAISFVSWTGSSSENYKRDLVISNSQFTENKASLIYENKNYGNGGALNIGSDRNVNISKCTFTKNTAAVGGAISSSSTNISIKSSNFNENTAYAGGAIYSDKGPTYKINIITCKFTKNTAKKGFNGVGGLGGGAIYSYSTLNVDNSVFSNNRALKSKKTGGSGGAIQQIGILTVKKSRFQGNTAEKGGAISLYKSKGTITKSTFNKNKAKTRGHAVYFEKFTGKTPDTTKGSLIFSKNSISANKGKYTLYRHKTNKKKLYANNNYWGKGMNLKKAKKYCYGVNISKLATLNQIKK